MITTYIKVSFQVDGIHNWPDAKHPRKWLAHRHRHQFTFTVKAEVFSNDREIEFFDLRLRVRQMVHDSYPLLEDAGVYEFRDRSCEHIALYLMTFLKKEYPNRDLEIEVSEDNEVSAVVTYKRDRK